MIGDPVAIRIRREIKRASKRHLKAFSNVQTSFIADAMNGQNCLHHTIKPLIAADRFVGTAVTASGGPRDLLAAMAMLDVARPGDVLVIATGGDESGAVVGDFWSAIAKKKGVCAVVTDGLVRDTAGIEKTALPTFARGASPNSGHQNGPGEVNCTVSIGGVSVAPGDIVVGDRDGVVVVPAAQADEVVRSLREVIKNEARLQRQLAKGKLTSLWDASKHRSRGVVYLD